MPVIATPKYPWDRLVDFLEHTKRKLRKFESSISTPSATGEPPSSESIRKVILECFDSIRHCRDQLDPLKHQKEFTDSHFDNLYAETFHLLDYLQDSLQKVDNGLRDDLSAFLDSDGFYTYFPTPKGIRESLSKLENLPKSGSLRFRRVENGTILHIATGPAAQDDELQEFLQTRTLRGYCQKINDLKRKVKTAKQCVLEKKPISAELEEKLTALQKPEDKIAARYKKLALALQLVGDHPDWSDAKIARHVVVDRATLGRWPAYQTGAAIAREKKQMRKGFKNHSTGEFDAVGDGAEKDNF